MRVPVEWLKEYVGLDIPTEELAARLTMAGLEVSSIEYHGGDVSNVVVGEIKQVAQHPNADRLVVCTVDTGTEAIQIVTGASNIAEGQRVPVALHGAVLANELRIKRSKIRGVESFGMLCSQIELGIGKDAAGIMILPADAPLGKNVTEFLGLGGEVLEIDILPNRVDCLSIIGIARDVAAILGKTLKLPKVVLKEGGGKVAAQVEVSDPDLCPRYMARVISGVKIGESPDWLKRRITAAGIRPINNIVDITNYLLIEVGQPLHAFDLNRLDGKKILVRRVKKGERIETLDGAKHDLPEDVLCIADAKRPVAVAGVMGGVNSEVSPQTKDILLESAYFTPTSIYHTSKKLKLRTESSMRFERGVDWEGVEWALDRAAQLMNELGGGEVQKGKIDIKEAARKAKEVTLRPERVRSILGLDIKDTEMERILKGLGFTVAKKGHELAVAVPLFRCGDIEREIDLIEEIARIYGYNKIPDTLPSCAEADYTVNQSEQLTKRIREILTGYGLNEVITFSIVNPGIFRNFPAAGRPEISNPLSEENSVLRTSLLPSLLNVLVRNARRQEENVHIFEISTTFKTKGKDIIEETRIAGLMVGSYLRGNWAEGGAAPQANFYSIKGVVEALIEEITGELPEISKAKNETLQPGRAADIKLGGSVAGWLGQLNNTIQKSYDILRPIFIFDLAFAPLLEKVKSSPRYQALPKFPAVTRDLALTVPNGVVFGDVERIINKYGDPILEEAALFDRYSGKPIPEGHYSLAFSLRYRDPQRTLTDDVVNKKQAEILQALDRELGVKLR